METKSETTFVPTVNEEAKKIAIIAYITIIGLIIAYIMNNEKKFQFARYHIRQSLGLGLTILALWIIGIIPILGWIISIVGFFAILYMWIMGLMNAINDNEKPIPFIGNKFEIWFKGIG